MASKDDSFSAFDDVLAAATTGTPWLLTASGAPKYVPDYPLPEGRSLKADGSRTAWMRGSRTNFVEPGSRPMRSGRALHARASSLATSRCSCRDFPQRSPLRYESAS
jgi:hypothetical protein